MGGCGLDLSDSGYGCVAGFFKHCHEEMGSINLGNLLTGKGSVSFSRILPIISAMEWICCHLNVRAGSMPFQEVFNVLL
jgi:hypothetical protein